MFADFVKKVPEIDFELRKRFIAADLTVAGSTASRSHAHIEQRKQYFVLVDHSTNGTFVQTEDERVTFLRRGEMRLWGNGWIALGEPLSSESAIRFRHT